MIHSRDAPCKGRDLISSTIFLVYADRLVSGFEGAHKLLVSQRLAYRKHRFSVCSDPMAGFQDKERLGSIHACFQWSRLSGLEESFHSVLPRPDFQGSFWFHSRSADYHSLGTFPMCIVCALIRVDNGGVRAPERVIPG
jgi:hypothetical protein